MKLYSKVPGGPLEQKWDRHRFELRLVNPANKRKYHVIVVGSGLAGASAAASLGEAGGGGRGRAVPPGVGRPPRQSLLRWGSGLPDLLRPRPDRPAAAAGRL